LRKYCRVNPAHAERPDHSNYCDTGRERKHGSHEDQDSLVAVNGQARPFLVLPSPATCQGAGRFRDRGDCSHADRVSLLIAAPRSKVLGDDAPDYRQGDHVRARR
jgi:hypothetical protein